MFARIVFIGHVEVAAGIVLICCFISRRLCVESPSLSHSLATACLPAMYLMYYLNDAGQRVYTLKVRAMDVCGAGQLPARAGGVG